jgi:DNA primase
MDQVEEVKTRLDVAEVIGGYVQLKQAGRNLKAPCPFHQEKTASFMVSPEKQIWHCFGCHQGGDVIKFVMMVEALEFREALELLARRAGIELKTTRDRGSSKLKERFYAAHELAVKYYQASLVPNKTAVDYLKRRGLDRQTFLDFQIGYAPDSWEGLSRFLLKKGFSEEELIKGGLAAKKRGVYDLFRGRIMLPICDAQGRPVGFTGRVLNDDTPKYLNTPQTLLYDKSRAIYGLHLAKDAIRKADEVVLVEGNMDVVAAHQAGFKQTVAASGTALTLDQLKTLSRFTKNIKLAFDQDAAGLTATERAIDLGQKLGVTLKMVVINGAKDPDELIKKDPKLWEEAVAGAKYVLDYLFERFEKEFDLDSGVGKRQFSDRLASNIKRLADPVEKDHYINLLAEKIGTSPDSVRQKVDGAKTDLPARPLPQPKPLAEVADHKDERTMVEEALLSLVLAYPEARGSLEDITSGDFEDDIRAGIARAAKDDRNSKPAELIKGLPEVQDYAKILTLRGEEEYGSLAPADRSFEAFQLVRRLQTLASKKTKGEILKQLREAEENGDVRLRRDLLKQYQALIAEDL